MNLVLQLLVGLWIALFSVMGLAGVFAPAELSGQLGITPDGVQGLNAIRGDLGGMFLATATMMAVGLRTRQTTWFLAVAVLMGAIAVGRLVGMAVDGPVVEAVGGFVIEVAVVATMIGAQRRLAG